MEYKVGLNNSINECFFFPSYHCRLKSGYETRPSKFFGLQARQQKKQKKNPQFIIYYNNDKWFLVLIICISLLSFISFFFQKAENNGSKKAVDQNFVIIGCVGPVDQQINLVLPNENK